MITKYFLHTRVREVAWGEGLPLWFTGITPRTPDNDSRHTATNTVVRLVGERTFPGISQGKVYCFSVASAEALSVCAYLLLLPVCLFRENDGEGRKALSKASDRGH